MKKTTIATLAVATALCASASAHAQQAAPSMYAEIGYTQLNAKDTDPVLGTLKFSPGLVTGVFGYQFTPNLAVEGMLGLGAGKDRIQLGGVDTGVDGQLKRAVGVFFKPSVAVADRVDLFGRVGWVRSELELSAGGFSASETDTDIAYGIGANFNLSRTSYIQASWMKYFHEDGLKIQGFTVAYGMRF